MRDQTTKLCDFNNAPNAQFIASPITSPEIKADSFEVSPGLLNLIGKINLAVVLVMMLLCICMIFVKFVICKKLKMLKMI
jgi:hypothetical protein